MPASPSAALLPALEPPLLGAPLVELFAARILLIEQDSHVRRRLAAALRSASAQVAAAADGGEGVAAAAAAVDGLGPFDAIVVDMLMREASETVRRLRADGYRGPILGLVATAGRDAGRRCLDAGCTMLAEKPITNRTLLATLQRLLVGHAARPAVAGADAAPAPAAPVPDCLAP